MVLDHLVQHFPFLVWYQKLENIVQYPNDIYLLQAYQSLVVENHSSLIAIL